MNCGSLQNCWKPCTERELVIQLLCFEQPFLLLLCREEISVQESLECTGKQIKARSCCSEEIKTHISQAFFFFFFFGQFDPSTVLEAQFSIQFLTWILARDLWVLQTMTLQWQIFHHVMEHRAHFFYLSSSFPLFLTLNTPLCPSKLPVFVGLKCKSQLFCGCK